MGTLGKKVRNVDLIELSYKNYQRKSDTIEGYSNSFYQKVYTFQGMAMVLVSFLDIYACNFSLEWIQEIGKGITGYGLYYNYGYYCIPCEKNQTTFNPEVALFS